MATNIHQELINHQDRLLGFAYSLTESRDDARELFQETALRALNNEDKFNKDTNFAGWAFTLMRNIFINNYRKMVRHQIYLLPTEEGYSLSLPSGNSFDSPESNLDTSEIMKAMSELDKDSNTIFTLYVSGYKYQEIADQLMMPIGTVKSRIFMARKQLMHTLKDYQ